MAGMCVEQQSEDDKAANFGSTVKMTNLTKNTSVCTDTYVFIVKLVVLSLQKGATDGLPKGVLYCETDLFKVKMVQYLQRAFSKFGCQLPYNALLDAGLFLL